MMSNLHLLQPGWVTVGKGVHDLPDRNAKRAEPVQDGSGKTTHGGKLGRDVKGVQVNASTRNQNTCPTSLAPCMCWSGKPEKPK